LWGRGLWILLIFLLVNSSLLKNHDRLVKLENGCMASFFEEYRYFIYGISLVVFARSLAIEDLGKGCLNSIRAG
jgi:hypothetical protein